MSEQSVSHLPVLLPNQPTNATCSEQLPQITIGNSDFLDVRFEGTLFVDKTAKIADLVKIKKVFFARPRRFGKSMLISMLTELFSHGTEKFEGLAIHDTWPDDQCYPVIALSLNVSPNPQVFEQQLCEQINNALEEAGLIELVQRTQGITTLSTLLWKIKAPLKTSKTVWLIDEWDYALSHNLDNQQAYTSNLHIIGVFFSWLRGLTNVRYLFVTGIGRYRDTTLFTGQDIINISMNPNFADLLGYTQAEVETNFAPYIARASEMMGLSRDELLAQLKRYYDGFCFEENVEISLYCPWSINNFFQQFISRDNKAKPAFRPFWMDSSNAYPALRTFLNSRNVDISFLDKAIFNDIEIKQSQFNNPTTFKQVDLKSILVQTGFFSLKSVVDPNELNPNDRSYLCGFPNWEVARDCTKILMQFITKQSDDSDSDKEFDHTAKQLNLAIKALDITSAVKALNFFLRLIPFDVWVKNIEATYRTFIHLLLIFSELSPVRTETYNGQGRSDLEAEFDQKLLVIELKRLDSGAQHKACLNLAQQAQDQIVERDYGHNLDTWQKPPFKERKGLVLVISDDSQQIVYWRLLSLEQAPEQVQVLGEGWGAPLVTHDGQAPNKQKKASGNKASGQQAQAPNAQSAAQPVTATTKVIAANSTATKNSLNEAQTQDAHSDAHEGQEVEQITPMAVSVFLSMSKPQAQTTDQVELNAEALINGVMEFARQLQESNEGMSADQIRKMVALIIKGAQQVPACDSAVDRKLLLGNLVNLLASQA